MHQSKVLDLVEKQDGLLTAPEIAYKLQIPVTKLQEELNALKNSGKIRELTLERLLIMEK